MFPTQTWGERTERTAPLLAKATTARTVAD